MSVDRLVNVSGSSRKSNVTSMLGLKIIGYLFVGVILIALWPIGLLVVIYMLYKYFSKSKNSKSDQAVDDQVPTEIFAEGEDKTDPTLPS